jgi:hypothetical protein
MAAPAALLAPPRMRDTGKEVLRLAVASTQRVIPGALQPDTARAIVVISSDGELAVSLRERVEPHRALIRNVRHFEARAAIVACRPFPWMVVGEGNAPAALVRAATSQPILVVWRVPVPRGLGRLAKGFERFVELGEHVESALTSAVGNMRLARGEGVVMPDGAWTASPHLQALIAAHPSGFRLTESVRRSVRALVMEHGSGARLLRDRSGLVVLR